MSSFKRTAAACFAFTVALIMLLTMLPGTALAKSTLPAPIVMAASAGYNSVKIEWTPVNGAKGYRLYSSTTEDGTYSLIKTTSLTDYTNTNLKTGKTYYYKVRAYKMSGGKKAYGEYSDIVSAKPMLDKVTGVKAKVVSPTSVKISWNSVSGAQGYIVLRSKLSNTYYQKVRFTSEKSYVNKKLKPSIAKDPLTYYYKVCAYRDVDGKRVYGYYTDMEIAEASPFLADVTGVKAVRVSSEKTKVTWDKVAGAIGYQVAWTPSTAKGFINKKNTTSGSYTCKGLEPGVTYYFKVRAYVIAYYKYYSAFSPIVTDNP